jgi:hypothetical protein
MKASAREGNYVYYARFTCRLKKKPRVFAFGSDLAEAKGKLGELRAMDWRKHYFDLDRQRPEQVENKPKDGKAEPWTFAEWAELYTSQQGVSDKRSPEDDMRIIRLHLEPIFRSSPLTEITRESLVRYIERRKAETVIAGARHR